MTVVYVDKVFALNTIIDYLLLLTTAQLLGAPLRRWQFGAAAIFGGIYAVALFSVSWLQAPTLRIVMGILMSGIAFAGEVKLWRCISLFLLLAGALAGILLAFGLIFCHSSNAVIQRIYYADMNGWVLIISAVLFYFLLEILFRQEAHYSRGEIMDVTVSLAGKSCQLRTLYDSGNTLRNPVDGTAVLIAETEMLRSLWNPTTYHILAQPLPPEDKLKKLYENGDTTFSLLPFRSVGRETGLLLAVRSDYIRIGRRICPKTMVALYPGSIGGAAYHGLWGGKEKGNETDRQNSSLDTQAQTG